MGPNMYYKKHIEKLINSNPANITIKRRIETDDGYGGSIVGEVTKSATVTFYERKARREVISDYGTTYTGINITKILASFNADIKKDDIFTHDDYTYKVLFVKPYLDICKQIELEVIK